MEIQLTKFEEEVINILLASQFSKEDIKAVINSPIQQLEFNDTGYSIKITNDLFNVSSITIEEPVLFGKTKQCMIGFNISIDNQTLTLNCNSWDMTQLTPSIRQEKIEVMELVKKETLNKKNPFDKLRKLP